MPLKVGLIYNRPEAMRYQSMGENKAEIGVLDEVKAVTEALDELDYTAVTLQLSPPLSRVKTRLSTLDVEVVFNLFEGFAGEPRTESRVAALLEELEIPFTGCPANTLALALNKTGTKKILKKAGLPTPDFRLLKPGELDSFDLPFPCIVKPASEDASHGISEDSVVSDYKALEGQVEKISRLFGGKALVEQFIDGREFNTTVMGNRRLAILAISEIEFSLPPGKPHLLTFESKWVENSLYFDNTRAICPAQISRNEADQIGRIAKKAYRLLDCRGYARVDLRQDRQGNFFVLEVNPNPDITPGSGAALQSQAAGMSYARFVDKILRLALDKHSKKVLRKES